MVTGVWRVEVEAVDGVIMESLLGEAAFEPWHKKRYQYEFLALAGVAQ